MTTHVRRAPATSTAGLAIVALGALVALSARPAGGESAAASTPARAAFEVYRALAGDWLDADGSYGMQGQVAVSYRLTGAQSAVVETVFTGQPHEMTSVYTLVDDELRLTHFCVLRNQPELRLASFVDGVATFTFAGGRGLDPARDWHMHEATITFVSANEIASVWTEWRDGAPLAPRRFRLQRKQP